MNQLKKPTMLMILDGFGINKKKYGNSIAIANTPNLDGIFKKYPSTSLKCSGLDVGLPEGQMGNSEVGHLNIGAGRIIYQDLTKISKAIEDKSFFKNKAFNEAIQHSISNNSALHILGLVSDGGVHSHITHLFALLEMAKKAGVTELYVHCFLDGRDVPPNSGLSYIRQLEEFMDKIKFGKIALLSGRYYAMDRDKRWDRLEKAYDVMTLGEGEKASDPISALEDSYSNKVFDEFVVPTIMPDFKPVSDNDALIMFNFRPDRAREITRALVDINFDGFPRKKVLKDLFYVCMTEYDATMPNVHLAFTPESYENTLGEYISSLGLNQLRIAETEKYAHVTFFFNGGVEKANTNEDRILIPSPKVATYDMQPEMSAYEVTKAVLEQIENKKYDLIILNFANADMVGHTGNLDASKKAIETLDILVPQIVKAILKQDGQILLTADHGNAEYMLDKNGNEITSHSTNPVPLVNISNNPKKLAKGGRLADISPTILNLMNIPIPPEMTGKSLIKK